MATIGQQFKAAREAKGVTEQEAGRVTKILTKMICEMEADDFSSMAAPAYARGFIRMYARYLDLDADKLVQQYVEERSGGIKEQEDQRKGKVRQKAVQGRRVIEHSAEWVRVVRGWLGRQVDRLPALAKQLPQVSLQDIRVKAAVGAAGLLLVVLLIVVGNCARRQAAASRAEQVPDDLEFLLLDEPFPDLYLVEPGRVERVQ